MRYSVDPEPGCVNFHEVPTPWQFVQVAVECLAGRVWHEVQLDPEPGWAKVHADFEVWHEAHALALWLAGRVWQLSHEVDDGCRNAQLPDR